VHRRRRVSINQGAQWGARAGRRSGTCASGGGAPRGRERAPAARVIRLGRAPLRPPRAEEARAARAGAPPAAATSRRAQPARPRSPRRAPERARPRQRGAPAGLGGAQWRAGEGRLVRLGGQQDQAAHACVARRRQHHTRLRQRAQARPLRLRRADALRAVRAGRLGRGGRGRARRAGLLEAAPRRELVCGQRAGHLPRLRSTQPAGQARRLWAMVLCVGLICCANPQATRVPAPPLLST